jgi:helicase MOV-10
MDAALLSRISSDIRYSLSIPGLAEGRPSVVRGDLVTVSVHNRCFQAEVLKVTKESAILEFPKSFESYFVNGLKVDVRFHFKRLPLRTAHQAVEAVEQNPLADHILFPNPMEDNFTSAKIMKPLSEISTSPDLKLFNRNLNAEQQAAVMGILSSIARPSPYIIYAPPGTGKVMIDIIILFLLRLRNC